jgi:transcriptional regulator with XRE-family HTH domain
LSIATRLQGRLERLELAPDEAARAAGLPADVLRRILENEAPLPRGQRLVKLAEALETSVAYLIGLDPDAVVPEEFLQEDQGALGLLALDEETILRAYRRLDISSRAAVLRVLLKMAPEPEDMEKKPLQRTPRK